MSTSVEICNFALGILGASRINSINDETKEAQLCKGSIDMLREELLRSHPWNFAIKRKLLAATVQEPEYEFRYKFTLPSDCLRFLEAYSTYNWKLEGDGILTSEVSDPNSPLLEVRYVANITDMSAWDATVKKALGYALATQLSYAITGKDSLFDRLTGMYEMTLDRARAVDATEDVQDPLGPFETPIISDRYF